MTDQVSFALHRKQYGLLSLLREGLEAFFFPTTSKVWKKI